jgi:asparagine synthase (glutamine-hydrolysing)
VHYAAQAPGARLKTFSVTFHGRSFDESGYVRQVADHYGTDHTEFDLNPERELAEAIHQLAYYCDEPTADSGALPVWFLSRMTKASVTVALSGEGADELFGGYLTHRASLLAGKVRTLPSPMLRALLAAVRHWPVSDDKIAFEYKVKRFLEGCLMPAARAHVYWGGTFGDDQKRSLIQPALPDSLDSVLEELAAAGGHLESYLRFDQKYYLPDDILMKVDRTSMAHALEVRPPYLDHRIVEFAGSLPPSLKIDGSRQKVILRNLMRNKLPPAILRRKKIGFDIPAHDWFRGPLRPVLDEALAFAAAEHGDFFDMARIQACVDAHLDRRANLGFHLWGLMTLFLWMKRWRIESGADTVGKAPEGRTPRTIENAIASTL